MIASRITGLRTAKYIKSNKRRKASKHKNQRFYSNFSKLLGPNSDRGVARIFWLICCIFSAIICIYQLEDRFRLYFSNPTISRVAITQTEMGYFPTVTLCPANFNDDFEVFLRLQMYQHYKKLPRIVHMKNITSRKLLNMSFDRLNMNLGTVWSKYSLNESSGSSNVPCAALKNKNICINANNQRTVNITNSLSMLGKCFHLTLSEAVEYHGPSTYWQFQFKKQNNLRNAFDHADEGEIKFLISELMAYVVHEVFYSAQLLVVNQHTDIYINSKEFHFLNLEHRPCREKKIIFDCRNECIREKLNKQLSCKLPFMNSTKLTNCTNYDKTVEAYSKAFEIYLLHSHSDCKCLPMCKEIIYNSLVDVVPMKLKNSIATSFTFFFSDNYSEIIEESFMYSFSALLSDFAGNVGFFLGISVLGFLQLIVTLFGRVKCVK